MDTSFFYQNYNTNSNKMSSDAATFLAAPKQWNQSDNLLTAAFQGTFREYFHKMTANTRPSYSVSGSSLIKDEVNQNLALEAFKTVASWVILTQGQQECKTTFVINCTFTLHFPSLINFGVVETSRWLVEPYHHFMILRS